MPSSSSPSPSASHILALFLLLTPSLAFIPIQPLPSDLDTNIWVPIATIIPTPTPSLEGRDDSLVERDPQGAAVTAPAAAQPATVNPDQISPITTYQMNEYRAGVAVAVNVVYTQTFPAIPEQWPSASAGNIGLGTIQGSVGVVRSKRSLPTQEPLLAEEVFGIQTLAVEAKPTAMPVGEVIADGAGEVIEPALVEINRASGKSVVAGSAMVAASLLAGTLLL